MLVFSEAQIKVFEEFGLDSYIKELMPHFREFSPELCMPLSDEELHDVLLHCIHRAESYGFTHRGPTQFFIEMMLLFGSGFDSDPQYPWAAEKLVNKDEIDQMERAETLHARTMEYMDAVDDTDNFRIYRTLKSLASRYPVEIPFKPALFEENMLRLLTDIHPCKAAEIGESALRRLVYDGRLKGERYGFRAVRSLGAIVVLMFSFGHDFDNDPFYPWIRQILSQTKRGSPDAVAEKLEQSAIDWIEAKARNKAAAHK